MAEDPFIIADPRRRVKMGGFLNSMCIQNTRKYAGNIVKGAHCFCRENQV